MPREKNLILDLHRLRHQVDVGEVSIQHCEAGLQLADVLTKERATDQLVRKLAEDNVLQL